MQPSNIDEITWQRLQAQADRSGCSVNALLCHWLEHSESSMKPNASLGLHARQITQLIENLPLAVAMFDTRMRYLQANTEWRKQYRLGDMPIIGKSHYDVFPEIGEDWKDIHRRCLQGEVNTNSCAPFPRHDGRLDWIRWEVRPWYLDQDQMQVGGLMMYTEVITEQVETEKALRESEVRYRALFEQANDLIALINIDGTYIDVNPRFYEMLGYTPDDLSRLNQKDIAAPEEYEDSVEMLRRLLAGEQLPLYERTLRRKDGSAFVGELNVSLTYDNAGDILYVQSIVRDISERKRMEAHLRESEEKYRLLVENSHQGMVIVQSEPLRVVFASAPMQAITGYTPEELMQLAPDQIMAIVHPEDRERFTRNLQVRMRGADLNPIRRYRLVVRDGQIRHIDAYSVRIMYEGRPAIQSAFLDVTDQVEADRLKLRFQKEQERTAVIQRIISMLSHDLRTPLAVISSSRDMLERYFDRLSVEARQEKLDTIRRQVQFATELLEDTVNSARGSLNTRQFAPRPINLATLCQVSIDEFRAMHNYQHEMVFINRSKLEVTSVDEVLVSRILLNLLSNAVKYSPAGHEIRLELDQRENWIVLRVMDQGMGIRAEDLPHIFDPFFRADMATGIGGTGLGLSIVKDCVARHEGQIHVDSVPGVGSTFTVELPLAQAGAGVS